MERLATLPLFFTLGGRRAVVVGGNEAAAWKAELLSAAGATVEVRDPDPCAEMEALAADPPGGAVDLERRPWSPECFAGAALVVGRRGRRAQRPPAFSMRHAHAACPVNVIDRPAYLHLPVRRHRQPLAAGGRHLDGWRGADLRPGHPLAHRGAAARRLHALGCRRQAMARRSQEARPGTARRGGASGSGSRRWRLPRRIAGRLAEDRKTLLAEARRRRSGRSPRQAMSRWSARDPAIRSC